MKSIISENKKILKLLFLLLFVIIYFSVSVFIFWDSAHYMSYVSIFEGQLGWENWDIVRGPIFPLIIYLSNFLFGKSAQGLLIMTFLFYIFMILCVYLILKKAFPNSSNNKNDKIVKYGTLLFILLDPIILGYYHALLTEFVAITLALFMCLMVYIWINSDLKRERNKSIFLTILFVVFTLFAWFLKQPYVSVVIFPVIIATIISSLKNKKIYNVIYRISTLLFCLIFLFISMSLWNKFLESKNIDLNSDRNVVSNFGKQLIEALNNFEIVDSSNLSIDDINANKFLNSSEKKYMIKNIKNNNYQLINVKSLNGNIIDQELVYAKNGRISTVNSFKFIIKNVFIHPLLTTESYTSNYLALANIYPKTTIDGVGYTVEKNISVDYCHEDCAIAGAYTSSRSSIYSMTDEMYARVSNYDTVNNPSRIFKLIYRILSKIYVIFYKFLILLLPIFTIITLVLRIKKVKNNSIDMCLILFGYSLLHVLVHVVTGACIDRYASPAYITSFIGLVFLIYNILILKQEKKKI